MAKCILLIGNIGSGKSTWVKENGDGQIIINDDSIVKAIHGGSNKYYIKYKSLYKSVENLIFGIGSNFDSKIIIDRPNLTVKTRRRYIGLAQCYDMKIEAVIFKFEDPKIHAERRMADDFRDRDFKYWENLAKYNNYRYQEPSLSEGLDSITYVESN